MSLCAIMFVREGQISLPEWLMLTMLICQEGEFKVETVIKCLLFTNSLFSLYLFLDVTLLMLFVTILLIKKKYIYRYMSGLRDVQN